MAAIALPLAGFAASRRSEFLQKNTAQAGAGAPAAPEGGLLYVVDSTGDGDNVGSSKFCDDGTGHCTLRAAIEASNLHPGADGIAFDLPAGSVINVPRSLPNIFASEGVSITGPGADNLTVRRNTGEFYRIFTVTTTGTVTLSGMTISDGRVGTGGLGGGILNGNAGTVNVTNCTLTDNYAEAAGGGIVNIGSSGTVNVTNCTLTGNSAGGGGGIYNQSGTLNVTNSTLSGNTAGAGAGILNDNGGAVTVTNSTLTGNDSLDTGGGGIFNSSGIVTVTNSTLSDNFSQNAIDVGNGGGVYNYASGTVNVVNSTLSSNGTDDFGGGIFNFGTVNITNSTLSGNYSGFGRNGGCIYNNTSGTVNVQSSTISDNLAGGGGGGVLNNGTANVTNSTISSNRADGLDSGGGISNNGTVNFTNSTLSFNFSNYDGGGISNAGTFNIKSSIIALNDTVASDPDVIGTFASQGYNLIGKKDGSTGFTAPTDQTGTVASPLDPKLDPAGPQNNGGPTRTIALLSDSPAIDKATKFGLTGTLTTDQRGTGFPRTFDYPSITNAADGDGTDVGAFELLVPFGVSRKMHGGAGTFDIPLPLSGSVGIECRSGGATNDYQMIIDFPCPVTVESASVTSGTGMVSSFSGSGSSQITVNLTGVTDAQRITMTLHNVNNGMNTGDVPVSMGVLVGDVNGNAVVNASDVAQTKSQVGQSVSMSNFREDVDASGTITATDVAIVKSDVGTALPP